MDDYTPSKPRPDPTLQSWSEADRVKYAEATGFSFRPKRKKGRVLPPHIVRQLAQPDYELEETEIQDLDPTSPTYGQTIWKRYRRYTEPHAFCKLCNDAFKLEAIRWVRFRSLEPEETVCVFCYRDLNLKHESPEPKPSPTHTNSSYPHSVSSTNGSGRGRKGMGPSLRYQRKTAKSALCPEEMGWLVAAALVELVEPEHEHLIDEFLEENAVVRHGQSDLIRFFKRDASIDEDVLLREFELFTEYQ